MDNTEAIGILRGATSPASILHPQIAADMGAQALAAWEWVLSKQMQDAGVTFSESRGWRCHIFGPTGFGDTPLAAVLDAMAKEAADGR